MIVPPGVARHFWIRSLALTAASTFGFGDRLRWSSSGTARTAVPTQSRSVVAVHAHQERPSRAQGRGRAWAVVRGIAESNDSGMVLHCA